MLAKNKIRNKKKKKIINYTIITSFSHSLRKLEALCLPANRSHKESLAYTTQRDDSRKKIKQSATKSNQKLNGDQSSKATAHNQQKQQKHTNQIRQKKKNKKTKSANKKINLLNQTKSRVSLNWGTNKNKNKYKYIFKNIQN